jgi:hypothetical protein
MGQLLSLKHSIRMSQTFLSIEATDNKKTVQSQSIINFFINEGQKNQKCLPKDEGIAKTFWDPSLSLDHSGPLVGKSPPLL